jgi:hypothetical protein
MRKDGQAVGPFAGKNTVSPGLPRRCPGRLENSDKFSFFAFHNGQGVFFMVDKLSLMNRLRGEGRWAEAESFKDATLTEFKAAGRKDAAEAAWEATAAKYPPLTNAGEPAAEAPAAVADKGPPWKDLPDSTDIDDDRRWAYNWASVCIDRTATGVNKINWHLATRPPSKGALLQMMAAASSPQTFIEAVNKTLGAKQGEEDEENQRREKKSIAEIRKVLAGFRTAGGGR